MSTRKRVIFITENRGIIMKNKIPELIPDEAFQLLHKKQLFHKINLRNYMLRRDFRLMKKKMSTDKAIEKLKKKHPDLAYATLIDYIY